MRMRSLLVAIVCLASGCPIDGAATGEECSKKISELKDLCPVNTMIQFEAMADGSCGADGKYQPAMQSAELGGTCASMGACKVACIATGLTCPCGISKITKDAIECREQCPDGCGDGECGDNESEKSCPGDCAMSMEPEAGSSGGAGSGASGSGGSSAGSGGKGGSSAGAGGNAGSSAASARCAAQTFGSYLIREDGHLLHVPDADTQNAVLNGETVSPLGDVVSVAEGFYNNYANANVGGHGCAALADGTVWCWRTHGGGNSYGQLGNGETDSDEALYRASQVLLGADMPLTGVKSMARGNQYSSCAVTEEGKLYCWGSLDWLVNNGAALESPYAQPITLDGATPLEGVIQAATDLTNGCAVLEKEAGNEVWCWGHNGNQQLGQGDTMHRQYPTMVAGLTNPTEVAIVYTAWTSASANTGQVTACALDEGRVRCWGHNQNGAAGVGPDGEAIVSVPTLVKIDGGTTPLDKVQSLVPGDRNICALREGATVWCWGQRFGKAAKNIGATNVTALGSDIVADSSWGTNLLRYITSDGLYHIGTKTVQPNCNALE